MALVSFERFECIVESLFLLIILIERKLVSCMSDCWCEVGSRILIQGTLQNVRLMSAILRFSFSSLLYSNEWQHCEISAISSDNDGLAIAEFSLSRRHQTRTVVNYFVSVFLICAINWSASITHTNLDRATTTTKKQRWQWSHLPRASAIWQTVSFQSHLCR